LHQGTTAALAVLDEFDHGQLIKRATMVGNIFMASLRDLAAKQPRIREIRGIGLMIGIALEPGLAVPVKMAMLAQGYLVGSVGDSVIRLLPPLILPEEEIAPFIAAMAGVLKEV
jgi:acetylornithine/N-succinyldiaminopimelate aminotransferase